MTGAPASTVDLALRSGEPQAHKDSARAISWICCQLGAREHYAIPRALQRAGVLAGLITDMWAPPSLLTRSVYPRRARERHHAELDAADVRAHSLASTLLEIPRRASSLTDWERMIGRNQQFERLALRDLRWFARRYPDTPLCLFSFSYTARRLFEFAKARGWTTVLGQIDPGPEEERIVAGLHHKPAMVTSRWQPAPASYWREWREECALADRIVVNSRWSRQLLMDDGIPEEKIRTIPLAYERSPAQAAFRRDYPESFTPGRPLRVLFLGQVALRKGISALLDAMLTLANDPVEFWFVGPSEVEVEESYRLHPNARWCGAVPRGEVGHYYRQADVLLFPTFSDGFGITQLEAQAWRLPVVASRFCGEVVHDGVNGAVLPKVSAYAIVEALRQLVRTPATLKDMSRNAVNLDSFGLDQLSARLVHLA